MNKEFTLDLQEENKLKEKCFSSTANQQPTLVEFLYKDNNILISTQTKEQNTITQLILNQNKEKQETEIDTLTIITNTKNTIPILLNSLQHHNQHKWSLI